MSTSNAAGSPSVVGDAERTYAQLLHILHTEPSKLAELSALLMGGKGISKAAAAAADSASVKSGGRAKKVPVALPSGDGIPTESDYRLTEIDETVCVGRNLSEPDKRWSVAVFREVQCAAAISADGLCEGCSKRAAKYTGKAGPWHGRVTEEPPAWLHMLGTEWAAKKDLKWLGADASGSDGGSVVSAESSAKMSKAEEKDAEKAKKAAEKEADKAKKAAEKEAEKAKKAAEKEAEKAKKAAEKEAEKAAKGTKKAAPKKAAAAGGAETVSAKANVVAEPVSTKGEVELIEGTYYLNKNGNLYEWDEFSESAGDFIGRKRPDGTIDMDAEEVTAEESDSD